MSKYLNPCPFCGGMDIHLYNDGAMWYYVFCNDCRSRTTMYYDDLDAIEMWNMRDGEAKDGD